MAGRLGAVLLVPGHVRPLRRDLWVARRGNRPDDVDMDVGDHHPVRRRAQRRDRALGRARQHGRRRRKAARRAERRQGRYGGGGGGIIKGRISGGPTWIRTRLEDHARPLRRHSATGPSRNVIARPAAAQCHRKYWVNARFCLATCAESFPRRREPMPAPAKAGEHRPRHTGLTGGYGSPPARGRQPQTLTGSATKVMRSWLCSRLG